MGIPKNSFDIKSLTAGRPKVSVCMASFNGEQYIERQLTSILDQLTATDEIIISDDSSTDNTQQIVCEIADKRIRFIYNMGSKGPVGNFQNALKAATGDVIFLCDQDDVWLPNKINITLSLLEYYDLVLSDCKVVNKHLQELHPSFFAVRGSRKGFLRNLYKNSYMGCCMAFKRKALSYLLPFPRHVHMHDWWIGLMTEIRGKVFFYEEPLILYVRHGNNASPTGEGSLGWPQQLVNRFVLLAAIIRRSLV